MPAKICYWQHLGLLSHCRVMGLLGFVIFTVLHSHFFTNGLVFLSYLLSLSWNSSIPNRLQQDIIQRFIYQFFHWSQIKDANRLAQQIQPYDEQEAQSQVPLRLSNFYGRSVNRSEDGLVKILKGVVVGILIIRSPPLRTLSTKIETTVNWNLKVILLEETTKAIYLVIIVSSIEKPSNVRWYLKQRICAKFFAESKYSLCVDLWVMLLFHLDILFDLVRIFA